MKHKVRSAATVAISAAIIALSAATACAPESLPQAELPTMASLRFQLYTDLAFGAQGLQYFSYYPPKSAIHTYHDGLIDDYGNKTNTYPIAQAMNKEIQARAG